MKKMCKIITHINRPTLEIIQHQGDRGDLGVFSEILLILAYVGSPTYLVSKMGSLSSQLRTVVEI